ncbi:PREDICTED: sodium-dependent neutral amino acid transporter B(0)AT3-like [Acropora digitifera]|uniref:sodium-dependent neutral amino acid transporter B(0)AT3-like n=1 Tax=Acropora digitifera TaxID=70779 RepID=UPI00077A3002|nr:PREDICTED: sodium-dependent neutral amino acid transporter B(0)AT3-like [Acropora digitifera]
MAVGDENLVNEGGSTRKTVSTVAILGKGDEGNTGKVEIEVVENEKVRLGWDNKMQFLLSAIGFAVGLGNVWRFPWLCQKNGGGNYRISKPEYKTTSLDFNNRMIRTAYETLRILSTVLNSRITLVVYFFVQVVYFTATFPYVVLIAFFIRGLMLKGFEAGLVHLFTPKWERLLDPLVWLDAATQIFFSLGLAFGTMVAYASYNTIHQNTLRDALTISIANCMTSLFAGVVVFSILGFRATYMMENCEAANEKIRQNFSITLNELNTTGLTTQQVDWLKGNMTSNFTSGLLKCDLKEFLTDAASGPGLVFIAFTDAINQMPGAAFWSVMFFLMLLTLGLDSLFGALESVTSALKDVRGFKKLPRELLSGKQLDRVVQSASKLMLDYKVTQAYLSFSFRFSDDIEYMTGSKPNVFWKVCWMFITPAAMFTILVASIVLMSQGKASYYAWNKDQGKYEKVPYPNWAVFVAVMLVLVSVIFIPCVAVARYFGLIKYTRLDPVSLKDAEAAKPFKNEAMDTQM